MTKNKNIFQIPTTDFTFKKIFGTEANKRFLIDFLNNFVSKYTGIITDVTYLPTEQYGLNESERRAVFDLLCVDQNQQNFIIEMQRANQPDFAERSIFYLSRAISASMEKGGYDYHILPTYSVNLLDFELPEYKNSGECFQALFLTDQKNRILTTKVAIFYIKLRNFAAESSELTEGMRNWLDLLKNMPKMDDSDYERQKPLFRELMDVCRISKLNTMEKENYRKSVLEYEDVQRAVAYAKELAFEEGVKKGMEKGLEKGREETLAHTARKLLGMGLSIEDVVKATGLSEARVREMAG